MSLLDEVIDAHGGRRRWSRAAEVRARVHSGGLLIRTKLKSRRFASYSIAVSTTEQRAAIDPFPGEGKRGVFDGDTVRIESGEGETVEDEQHAREEFFGLSGLSRNLRWSDLDALYFCGYAMWNYLNTPWVLERPGLEVEEGEPLETEEGNWRCLEVAFPDGFHTHCAHQSFYFDEWGLLRRHDYAPDVVSRHAHAAHLCDEHQEFDGLVFPTRRRVVPKSPVGHPLPGPTIVSIDLDDVSVA